MFGQTQKKSRTIILKYTLIFITVIFIVLGTSCSIFGENAGDMDKTATATADGIELNYINDQNLEKELIDIAYINIEIQNGEKNIDLASVYTDSFIQNTINKDDEFYKELIIEKDPVAKYSEKNNEFVVIVWLKTKSDRNAIILENIIIKRDSSGELKISDIE